MNKRLIKDTILNIITYLFSSIGLIVLLAILIFVFSKGSKSLSFKMITGDYESKTYILSSEVSTRTYKDPELDNVYFSKVFGVGLKDSKDYEGNSVVEICYLAEDSVFLNLNNKTKENDTIKLKKNEYISKIVMSNDNDDYLYSLAKDGAKTMAIEMDKATYITDLVVYSEGGGIRGSIITTIYLIILTLIIALPLGILAAIFLHEYAKNNKITKIIRVMIDMTAGVPSIIFGLVGSLVFIPFVSSITKSSSGSILSGALTMTIVLLPTIIKNTEDALDVIPDSLRQASLGLGASKAQTIFKVVLPNSIPGILTATLLSVGRIIGESAALIYAIGATIKDNISISGKSTTLAVHIWSLMSGENPNYDLACAISIIIMIIVLLLSICVKLLSKRLNKMEVK